MTRKEAIEVLKDLWRYERSELSEKDIREALDIAINSVEIDERYELEYEQIEPCGDAISREPFTNSTICEGFSCEECSFNRKDKGGCILEERVMKLPSVTPQPKVGRWIVNEWANISCSECGCTALYDKVYPGESVFGKAVRVKSTFCPTCGAKMQEVEE